MKEMGFYELKDALKDVRRLLLTMIMDRSGKRLIELEPVLIETSKTIDYNISEMLGNASPVEKKDRAAIKEIKEIWEAFQKTRDEEIIPALHEGRFDDATKIAAGIQEERFRQFISIAELIDFSRSLETMLDKKTRAIRDNFFVFVGLFTDLVELFDSHIGGHCKRVSAMAKKMAERMGLEGTDVDIIEAASNLHALGMLGVPRAAFHKEEKELRKRERALLQNSPVLTQGLLSSIDTLKQAGVIIRSHMERYDGKGYPDGLKKEEIHIGARILAVCKSYDTARHRPDHPLHRLDAIDLLKSERGRRLDPALVNSFVEFLDEWTEEKILKRVPIAELESGMVLASDILTVRGTMLVSKGTELTYGFIQKIIEIDEIDPVVTAIKIVAKA